ncbi:MAG: AI-2E family transporter [Candidatus Eremiobacteraeota bacterium]|nr:AI-2E family transporter [Candidatus Eremiobacteraeota bacterium]MBV8354754.1 AI-2E family transporter [Candidatus Eremiobacteraeota bacterium]
MTAFTIRRILNAVAGILLVAALLWLATRIPRTVAVFMTAGVIALGVHPVTQFLERWMKRWAAITIVYLVLLGAVVVLALLVIPTVFVQIQAALGAAPDQLALLGRSLEELQRRLQTRFGAQLLPGGVGDLRSWLESRITEWGAAAVASVGPLVVGTFNALFIGISALILSIFFLGRGENVRAQILTLVPYSRTGDWAEVLDECVNIFGGFVAGQAILCTITGVSIWAILALLGFKFALLIGVLSGIAYAIPFAGMLVAQIVAAVLAIPQGTAMVGWVTIVIFAASRVADNVLVPKVMGPSVGVSPIAIMFGVFAGGELFGLPGLLLGIPAAAMGKVLWRIFVRPWLARHDIGPPPGVEPLGEAREMDIDIHERIIERAATPPPAIP